MLGNHLVGCPHQVKVLALLGRLVLEVEGGRVIVQYDDVCANRLRPVDVLHHGICSTGSSVQSRPPCVHGVCNCSLVARALLQCDIDIDALPLARRFPGLGQSGQHNIGPGMAAHGDVDRPRHLLDCVMLHET